MNNLGNGVNSQKNTNPDNEEVRTNDLKLKTQEKIKELNSHLKTGTVIRFTDIDLSALKKALYDFNHIDNDMFDLKNYDSLFSQEDYFNGCNYLKIIDLDPQNADTIEIINLNNNESIKLTKKVPKDAFLSILNKKNIIDGIEEESEILLKDLFSNFNKVESDYFKKGKNEEVKEKMSDVSSSFAQMMKILQKEREEGLI